MKDEDIFAAAREMGYQLLSDEGKIFQPDNLSSQFRKKESALAPIEFFQSFDISIENETEMTSKDIILNLVALHQVKA